MPSFVPSRTNEGSLHIPSFVVYHIIFTVKHTLSLLKFNKGRKNSIKCREGIVT